MTKHLNRYFAFVTVEAETLENAEQVLAERLGYDENYGFPYTLEYKGPQPVSENPDENTHTVETPKMSEPNGIVIDASVIRDVLAWTMDGLDEHDDQDNRLVRAHKHIASMSDDDLNHLISSTDNRFVWELYHDMCIGILEDVIDATVGPE